MTDASSDTLMELIWSWPEASPALTAPGRPALGFGALRGLICETIARLNALGIGRGDRVAIVFPNGPEMATAFLAVSAGATAAPLNPAYREEEFAFYMTDLGVKALLVEAESQSPAVAAATKLEIPVLRLGVFADAPAGAFEIAAIAPEVPLAAARGGFSTADDIALVLHTSGTTSRPKIVPLSQSNLSASARHIGATLRLTPADRCLNIMPLFHIHGLIAAVSSSLAAGAGVCCTPGFNALKFFSWLGESGASWYSAVPTMHQTILARAGRNRAAIEAQPLRFIRSSSASLPPQVMMELEATFDAPVIESYGMTEATHQMASNPLPPEARKAGTVGRAAGPEVAIMAPNGELLPAESEGEVVIRGPNVTGGYERNPEANAAAFARGWFRTGDQGVLDAEGYLKITGRLKEIINRGGEKVSPLEVDEVLMDHPAVRQVVTFALPHEKLGEEVAAAVVLREGAELDALGLRQFAATRLADFKVPRKILFLDEIPKGATGKLQRIGLAEKLGLTS